jgi:hypothetical protein
MKKNTKKKESFDEMAKRLLEMSNKDPLLPESFIPWDIPPKNSFEFMPEKLFSLSGTEACKNLTKEQERELKKAEIAQVMYSYAWSEGIACLFFFRYLTALKDNVSPEYQYLLMEAREECRHQQMFSLAIQRLGAKPIPTTRAHRLFVWISTYFLSSDIMFLSVLAIELVTDVYGFEIRKQKNIYPVLAKVSELHNIEEGRHIYFAQELLNRYTENAGIIKRTAYSAAVCINIYLMRKTYVRKEIFTRLGLDPKIYYKPAKKGLKEKFATHCVDRAVKFVEKWNGFNSVSRLVWKLVLGVQFK